MKNYFSIGEAAKMVPMTRETLRHYDRIGLVKPSKKDEWTGYRYYTEQDIVRLDTVRALQQMDLPLQEIKQVLEYNDLEKIFAFLEMAEKKADEKIALLKRSKAKIRLAKASYAKNLKESKSMEDSFIKYYPDRVLLLSDTLETPTMDILWNYLRHFYAQVGSPLKSKFFFEDLAGIYTEHDTSRLFAVCEQYVDVEGLRTLPAGNYLCASCKEENRVRTMTKLLQTAKDKYRIIPGFTVQLVVVSGILQWGYQCEIYLGS